MDQLHDEVISVGLDEFDLAEALKDANANSIFFRLAIALTIHLQNYSQVHSENTLGASRIVTSPLVQEFFNSFNGP